MSITWYSTSQLQHAVYLSNSSSVPVIYLQWVLLPYLSSKFSHLFMYSSW